MISIVPREFGWLTQPCTRPSGDPRKAAGVFDWELETGFAVGLILSILACPMERWVIIRKRLRVGKPMGKISIFSKRWAVL